MKKIFISTFVLIINYSLLIINCEAQWQPDVRLTNNTATSYTSFNNAWCIASSGDIVHAVWYDNRDGNDEIYYKRSTNSGANWGADTRLTNASASSNHPSITVSGQIVHLIWADGRNGNLRIYYKRSTDEGATWSADVMLTTSNGGSELPSVTVSGQNVHVAWDDQRDGNPEIYCKNSSDEGLSWGADIRLTNNAANSTHASVSVSVSTVHIVWEDNRDGNIEVYYKLSIDGGVSWGTDIRLTNNSAPSHNPSVSVSGSPPTADVHVVWFDRRDASDQLYYKRSTDGGSTWGTDTRLSTLPVASFYPSAFVSGQAVHIVWYGSPGTEESEIYYKRSTDGGLNWGTDTRITNNTCESSFASVCISGQTVHVVWQDERDGNFEVYYKRDPTGNPIGIININAEIPKEFSLSQNYPNPFNPSTKIQFALPKSSFAKLVVYDALGREVVTLVNEQLKPGSYEVDWSATGGAVQFSSGVYYYKLSATGGAGNYTETKKMILMK